MYVPWGVDRMLTEIYRPRDWPDVIGQADVTAKLARWEMQGKLQGRAYWLSGKSGTGKTTLARIIAGKLSNQFYTAEMDASEVSVIMLRNIKADVHYMPLGCASRVFIVNEAHGLSKGPVRILLQMLEAPLLNSGVTWVFTTTLDGQMEFEDHQIDAMPLLSRCIQLKLAERGLCGPMAARCREIATKEGLNGQDIAAYERLLKDKRNNMRAALQAIEAGVMAK